MWIFSFLGKCTPHAENPGDLSLPMIRHIIQVDRRIDSRELITAISYAIRECLDFYYSGRLL